MFEFLKEFFNKKTSKLKKLKYLKLEFVYIISREICELNSSEYYDLREGLGLGSVNAKPNKMFCYTIDFKTTNFDIEYCYQIRGSLIIIKKNHKEILSFVDQTIQYSGVFYYPNDIEINCSKKTLENLYKEIKKEINEKNV